MTVRLAGGDLRSEYGAPAPPESDSGISRDSGLQRSVDCTTWVIGGLWPAELSPITAETPTAAEYLKADLQRIVDSANEELKAVRASAISPSVRQSKEARVINAARAFAVRRVESTVRHRHSAEAVN